MPDTTREDIQKPSYYAIIPADVRYDTRLKPNEKLLYGEITALAQKDGYCWASNKWLAKLFSAGGKAVTEKTVSLWVSDLQKYGYIKTVILTKNGMISGRRIYLRTALPDLPAKLEIVEEDSIPKNAETYPEKNGDVSRKMRKTYPEKSGEEYYKSSNNTRPMAEGDMTPNDPPKDPTKDPASDLFDRFWAAYPRKTKKPQARKAWDKLKVNEKKLKTIMEGLERWKQCSQWTKDGGKYIAYPATWLNNEMFNDFPDGEPQQSQPDTPQSFVPVGYELYMTPDGHQAYRRAQT